MKRKNKVLRRFLIIALVSAFVISLSYNLQHLITIDAMEKEAQQQYKQKQAIEQKLEDTEEKLDQAEKIRDKNKKETESLKKENKKIKKELEKKTSKNKRIISHRGVEQVIEEKCEKYNVPYTIAIAIARLETGWFKSYAFTTHNNPGGLMYNGKLMFFNSVQEGVDFFVKNLANNYISRGLDTPETIGPVYCPVNTQHWIDSIHYLMNG